MHVLCDIVEKLETTAFPRLRVGIGKPEGHIELRDYVLSQPWGEDKPLMEEAENNAALAIMEYMDGGIDKARQFIGKLHENKKLDT